MTDDYQKQLKNKVEKIKREFINFLPKINNICVFDSNTSNFRQRVEFRLWHENNNISDNTGIVFYAMFEQGKKASTSTLKRIDDFPIASLAINDLMPKLLECLKSSDILISRLFQVEFLSTLNGETLVSLIYHKKLSEKWLNLALEIEKELGIYIVGRSRGQKIVLTQDFVIEKLSVLGKYYSYKQIESCFTQPNALVCQKMLNWSCEMAIKMKASDFDLLELYCGNGNFTLPLSKHFRNVLATEVAKTSVNAARYNIVNNNCNNISIARLSAEEITQAFNGDREFRRLNQDDIDIKGYDIKTIFVDPPRSGVDKNTLRLMQRFENILYMSCNASTLLDNLEFIKDTHTVESMAIFDQFPYTNHIEMGVWLKKIIIK